MSKKIIFIVGPTAVGKSNVANSLAEKLDLPIVSCDSAQVYKELNIASNKVSKQIQDRIPHHLIDVVSVKDSFDVAQYNRLALQEIEQILSQNRIPLIVGGTGLYMKILLDGISQGGAADQEFRAKLWKRAEENGSTSLYAELERCDPKSAQRIHPNDAKKIIRALEVYQQTGKSITDLPKVSNGLWNKYDVKLFALNLERDILYQYINERVDRMFEEGLAEEIQNIQHLDISQTATMIIGVKEVLPYICGECNLDRAKYLMKLNTRHYAKRQLTWFNREDRLQWVNVDQYKESDEIVSHIIKEIDIWRTHT